MAKKPVHKLRIGAVSAAIWENETDNGTWFNVTFSRMFKDGDTWKDSGSFSRDDLLVLAKLADQAHSWVCDQQQSQKAPA